MNLFAQKIIIPAVDLTQSTCHSGGAKGSDTYFSYIGKEYGVKTNAYSYKTSYHQSADKVEISESDYLEGVNMINKANHVLNRYGIQKYMNLLARNWSQVKYSNQTFAIGTIIEPKAKSERYYNKSKIQIVDGGTGYATQLTILACKPLFVYDQNRQQWFEWSYILNKFIPSPIPIITDTDFAGIGTREINDFGIQAIKDLYEKTLTEFKK